MGSVNIKQFLVGKAYYTRSICNHDCVFTITIQSRTEKTLRTSEDKLLRIKVRNGIEEVKPYGTYSMCPIISAEKIHKAGFNQ